VTAGRGSGCGGEGRPGECEHDVFQGVVKLAIARTGRERQRGGSSARSGGRQVEELTKEDLQERRTADEGPNLTRRPRGRCHHEESKRNSPERENRWWPAVGKKEVAAAMVETGRG
jgi:hypothetical protein